ncbi:30S ribosomal protein S7 [Candidatus Wolfebacteria bacterium]|nr:30S ribosomal protein S7 [Candidatus Wolfebacteria bacterium]
MRRPLKKQRTWRPDPKFNSEKLTRFMNYVMLDGKKETAKSVVYDAFDMIKEADKDADPMSIFDEAVKNAGPLMEVRSRRVGGANYQVPREVRDVRRMSLAYRWIITAARKRKGVPMAQALAEELKLAASNEGDAVKKKEDTHRMAEANKAFAHFAW